MRGKYGELVRQSTRTLLFSVRPDSGEALQANGSSYALRPCPACPMGTGTSVQVPLMLRGL